MPSLTKQDPSRLSLLEGMGGCPTSTEPLTPKQDISQTHSASSAPTTCSTPQPPTPLPAASRLRLPADLFFCQFPRAMQNQLPPERSGTAAARYTTLAGPRRTTFFLLFFLIEFLGWGEQYANSISGNLSPGTCLRSRTAHPVVI